MTLPFDQEAAMTAIAEIAYEADRVVRKLHGKTAGRFWDALEAAERQRWKVWVQEAIVGQVQVPPSQATVIAVAREAMRALNVEVPTCGPMDRVILVVAARYGVDAAEVTGKLHRSELARARHVSMYLCRHAGHSFSAIGRHFGRDHSTVITAVRKIEAEVEEGRGRDVVSIRVALFPSPPSVDQPEAPRAA